MSSNLDYTWAVVVPKDTFRMGLARWMGEVIDYQPHWILLREDSGKARSAPYGDNHIFLFKERGEAQGRLHKV